MSGARVYRVGSPYNAAELAEIDFEQSADTMYLAHIDHPPTKLTRSDHTLWTFSTITFAPTVAAPTSLSVSATSPNTDAANSGNAYFPQPASYCVSAIDDDSLQESRASTVASTTNDLTLKRNKNNLSWSAVSGAERYRIYKADNTGDFGYIGTTKATSFTDDNIGPDYSDGPIQGGNPFPAAGQYPSTVSFYQQRLFWARTSNRPNAIWGSRSGDYENHDTSRPLKDSDALSFALVAGRVNAVSQLASVADLLALTSDSVFKISGGQEGYVTPSNIVTSRENGRGGSRLSPLIIDNVVFYQTSVANSIRTLGYHFENDGYNSNDITIYSPGLFRGSKIVSWAYAQEPRSTIWAVRDDGKLLCFTWEQEQEVWGWTVCDVGGLVQSVCAISENGEDRLYLIVQRVIQGQTKVFVERMAAAQWQGVENTCFLDCASTFFFDTPGTVVTNLERFEGETLTALADGNVVRGLIVINGAATLPFPASTVTIGYPFTALVETLPLAIQTRAGWTIAKPQQASKVVLKVVNSRGLHVGPTEDKLDEIRGRSTELLGNPNALVTGDMEAALRPDINGGVHVVVTSPDPLPMTLTAVMVDPSLSE
jgi:hypothetical protein